MNRMFVKYVLPIGAVLMLVFGCYHVVRSQPSDEKLVPPAAPARSPYPNTVAAAGIVEARSENIAVGAAIPGIVLETWITPEDVGKYVARGAPLFRVDDRHLRAQLAMQQANLAAAQVQLAKLDAMPRPEEVPSAEAKLKAAEANVVLARDMAERGRTLVKGETVSTEELMQREIALEVALQQRAQAKADLDLLKAGAWQADKDVSLAAIALARAQSEQTATEIERATVRAPIAGHILQVSVHPGESVGTQPGQALIMIGDLTAYHVRVDIDEHDIPRFQTTAPARAYVRGHAQREIKLSFVRLEKYVMPKKWLTGDNTERVDTRVLQAIYKVEPGDQAVFVGQQLDVFIDATFVRTKP
jgi:multidrug efflux pump subunit AcrA (membrane-fusion protein)